MPITPTFPGIYIQEAPSSSHTVIAASTNVAVFIGYTHPLKTDPESIRQGDRRSWASWTISASSAALCAARRSPTRPTIVGDADNNVGDIALGRDPVFPERRHPPPTLSLFKPDADTSPPGTARRRDDDSRRRSALFSSEITDQIYTLKVQVSPVGTTQRPRGRHHHLHRRELRP